MGQFLARSLPCTDSLLLTDPQCCCTHQLCIADHCLAFMMSQDEATERILKRGETSGRSDDNEETVAKRFETFE
jgi:hypothetical protein